MKLVFPQTPHDEKKSVKLKYSDIEKAKHLFHVEKLNISEIADKFNVSENCIRYNIDEEFKRKQKVKSNEYTMKCYYNDEKFRERHKQSSLDNHKELLKKEKYHDLYKNYQKLYSKSHDYYHKNLDYYHKKSQEFYQNNKFRIRQKRQIRDRIKYAMRWF